MPLPLQPATPAAAAITTATGCGDNRHDSSNSINGNQGKQHPVPKTLHFKPYTIPPQGQDAESIAESMAAGASLLRPCLMGSARGLTMGLEQGLYKLASKFFSNMSFHFGV